MIIWINGAFGSGKSTVAEKLHERIEWSHIFDPEQVGYFLWDNFPEELKEKENFQHMPIWREFNYKILKYLNETYDGDLIIPMTLYTKQYYDEIIGSLIKDGIDVKHFILSASKKTIINRLVQRGEKEDCWAVQHIDKCINFYENEVTEIKIDTENKEVNQIVDIIFEQIKK